MAILTPLAALAAGAAAVTVRTATEWRSEIGREATIQVPRTPTRDLQQELARAAELAGETPGIASARVLADAEATRLLEPWLGTGLDLAELPVPGLVALRLSSSPPPDLGALARRLAAAVPGATLDDHSVFRNRLAAAANGAVALAAAVVALVLAAAGLAVAFATRGAVSIGRDAIEVLQLMGAEDDFIAREFGRRFGWLCLRSALAGAALATALHLVGSFILDGEIFGPLAPGLVGLAAPAFTALAVGLIGTAASWLTVQRFLNQPR